MPNERYRALNQARDLLSDLCIPSETPKVPGAVRDRARSVLRHFPTGADVTRLADASPEVLSPAQWVPERSEPAPEKRGWMSNFLYGKKAK
jgi:hypothetical protein